MAHGCYSGADKGVVYGLRVEAFIVVFGEHDETIILDARVIPPRRKFGQPRRTTAKWMMLAIERLNRDLLGQGLSLDDCYLSVDSAYAAGWFVRRAEDLEMKMVSELRSGLTVRSWFWTPVPARLYFALYWFAEQYEFERLPREPKVEFHRHHLQ